MARIREAQAIRGHRLKGLADWRPIVIPLLIGGLERAMGLAESMVSRGYGATASASQPLAVQLGLVAGLLFALTGWVLTFWIEWLGWFLMGSGLLLITLLMWQLGARTPFTPYRPRPWTTKDSLMLLPVALVLLLFFIPLPFVDRSTLAYTPYPRVSLPPFDPLIGLGLATMALPALMTSWKREN